MEFLWGIVGGVDDILAGEQVVCVVAELAEWIDYTLGAVPAGGLEVTLAELDHY